MTIESATSTPDTGESMNHHIPDTNSIERERLTSGQRIADAVARIMGSWHFIIVQSIVLITWIVLNVMGWINRWDPYPFILLNLVLSFQAAYSAPIIMMSQNRQAAKDRLVADHDYLVNVRAEFEIAEVRRQLDALMGPQWQAIIDLQVRQMDLLRHIDELATEIHRLRSSETRVDSDPR